MFSERREEVFDLAQGGEEDIAIKEWNINGEVAGQARSFAKRDQFWSSQVGCYF